MTRCKSEKLMLPEKLVLPKKGDTMYAVGIFSKGIEVVETSFYGSDHDFLMLAEHRLFSTRIAAERYRCKCEKVVAMLKEVKQ